MLGIYIVIRLTINIDSPQTTGRLAGHEAHRDNKIFFNLSRDRVQFKAINLPLNQSFIDFIMLRFYL